MKYLPFEPMTSCSKQRSLFHSLLAPLLEYRGSIFVAFTIDHFTVVAKLPGLRMEARLPVTLF